MKPILIKYKLLAKSTLLIIILSFYGCNSVPSYNPIREFKSIEKSLMTKLLLAEDGSVIDLDEGHFIFKNSLILDGKKHVTLRGKGIDKTVLSFKLQEGGAEGIKVANCENIVLEDFTIEDAAGDNIKVSDTKGITFRRVKSAWTGEISENNGAYAIYPVICNNVLIEECEVLGASDAGIYVGQSEDVIIRNNLVYWNVAGIESENSENVEIYGNKSYNNTGGILVFDLPGLTRYGKNIKVYDNEVYENNTFNFAPAGNIVGTVPPGTGVMVLATRGVEIYNNKISNNNNIGLGIVSYGLMDAIKDNKSEDEKEKKSSAKKLRKRQSNDPNYDPFPGEVYVHDNIYSNSYWLPDLGNDFGKLFLWKFGLSRPDIVWDGIQAENYLLENGTVNPDYRICVQEKGAKSAILDAANNFEALESNPESLNCKL
ncbi:MAG: right-handed parallel beta-helix repeat-containing protein [Cyclobacteriaceae bacterium]|jgi:parallel beta-helix repeat protein|nr:right-handed parallel beta-helix repeat-containing protein [Cyclobacteriaceae bacterium]